MNGPCKGDLALELCEEESKVPKIADQTGKRTSLQTHMDAVKRLVEEHREYVRHILKFEYTLAKQLHLSNHTHK